MSSLISGQRGSGFKASLIASSAGPGPVRDRTLVLEQWLHVSFLLYGVISSAAAVTIVITLTVLCFTCCSQKLRWV